MEQVVTAEQLAVRNGLMEFLQDEVHVARFTLQQLDVLHGGGYVEAYDFKNATREGLAAAGLPQARIDLIIKRQGAAAAVPSSAATTDETAGFLRSILPLGILPNLGDLHGVFTAGLRKDGRRVLLPVTDFMYTKLLTDNDDWREWIQPVSACNAHSLSNLLIGILDKRISQPGSELVMPATIDVMVYDVMQLLAERLGGVSMKRCRNQTEESLTWPSLRPDSWLLAAGTMLFKGEEKTNDKALPAARQDLLFKMKDWDPAYHGMVPYLLCYAAAGLTVQFCVIPRGQEDTLVDVTQVFNLNNLFHRLLIVHAAMLSYCIIASMAARLPPGHRLLGQIQQRPHGTTITILDSSVVKEVDCTEHPLLDIIKDRMCSVYAAAQDCPNLIHAMERYPKLRGPKYSVALVPVGTQLTVGSFRVDLLRVAVRCVLTGLSALHKAGYGHGDLRWENVIWVSDDCFVVIDLEGTISLVNQEEQQQVLRCESYPRAWGANKEALVDGQFTAASDLYMLGCMLQQIQQQHPAAVPELGNGLVQALLRKEVSLEQAQAHAWLQE